MATRPKYIAAKPFSAGGHRFAEGDPVENPVVLDAVLRHGDTFVTTTTRRAKAAAQPVPTEPESAEAEPTTTEATP